MINQMEKKLSAAKKRKLAASIKCNNRNYAVPEIRDDRYAYADVLEAEADLAEAEAEE